MEEEHIERVLEELHTVEKENNTLLKKINRHLRFGRFVSFLYWCIVIGSVFGLYYFLQPYLESLWHTYAVVKNFVDDPKTFIQTVLQQHTPR